MPRVATRDFGTAIRFNGASSHVSTASTSAFSFANSFTLSAWVRFNTIGAIQRFLANDNYGIGISAVGQLNFTTFSVKDYFDSSGFRAQSDTWYHIVVTMDSSQDASFYVNGVFKSTDAGTTNANTAASVFRIGARTTGAEWVGGIIDEPRVWGTALTAQQIAELYNGSIPSGAVGQWLFNEGSGTTATDTGSAALNGTITSASYTPDVPVRSRVVSRDFGTSLNATGSNWGASIPTSATIDATTAITVAAWAKTVGFGTERDVVSKWYTSFNWGLQSSATTSGWRWCIGINGGTEYYVNAPSASRRGEWQFLVGTYDGANSKLYIDGNLVGIAAATGNLRTGLATRMGSISGSPSLVGFVDEVRIWKDVALTQQQISDLYYRGVVNRTGLAVEILFDEGAGTTAADTSGNSNNATLTNALFSSDVPMRSR